MSYGHVDGSSDGRVMMLAIVLSAADLNSSGPDRTRDTVDCENGTMSGGQKLQIRGGSIGFPGGRRVGVGRARRRLEKCDELGAGARRDQAVKSPKPEMGGGRPAHLCLCCGTVDGG